MSAEESVERAIVTEADRIAHVRGRRSANAYIERAIAALMATREREASRQGMEEAAKIADVWEPDGGEKYPDYVNGWECEKTCEGIAESIRARAQADGAKND